MNWFPWAGGLIAGSYLTWLVLRLKLKWKLDNERRRTRTQLHSSEYNDKDETYD